MSTHDEYRADRTRTAGKDEALGYGNTGKDRIHSDAQSNADGERHNGTI